ncbi:MAG: hypothetical protein JNN26_27405, partial [Candidatus Obscuribacter sp.]|nr:hypothetical protein [Candidatus Obscuribacter sp.]
DPTFEADGTKTCRRHRCTLCHENAIITADSYPGLMLRQAELELDQENMPLKAFMNSDLDAELENTRSALSPLLKSDPLKVMQTIESYKGEIRSGRRRHAAGESGSGSF